MQNKFFIKRFVRYFLSLFIPTCLLFVVAFVVTNRQMNQSLRQQGEIAVSSVTTNLELVVNNLVFQNEQFTNNSYMGLSLKKILRRSEEFSYSDAIYLRTIKAMLGSMIQTYPYVDSVYLYLDGYENYCSSKTGLTEVDSSRDGWWENYRQVMGDKETVIMSRDLGAYGQSQPVLTIYQKMLLMDGVVVMNLNVAEYRKLLDSTLNNPYGTILYVTEDNETLFRWSETGDRHSEYEADR